MKETNLVRKEWSRKWREHLRSQRLVFLMEEDELLYNSLQESELFQSPQNELKFIFQNKKLRGSIDMSNEDFLIIDVKEEDFSHLKRVFWKDEKIYKIILDFHWLGYDREIRSAVIGKAMNQMSKKQLGKKSKMPFTSIKLKQSVLMFLSFIHSIKF